MTHRDGFPHASRLGFSARSAWRGDAGHRKPRSPSTSIGPSAPGAESLGKPPPVAWANRQRATGRASGSLDEVPHRLRLPSYPADRLPDLYGSLSTLLGISARGRGTLYQKSRGQAKAQRLRRTGRAATGGVMGAWQAAPAAITVVMPL